MTLRAVGGAAGVSQSAPYRHYADKRTLMDAMVRRIIEQLGELVESARNEADSSIAALNLVVSQYFEFARRYPVRYRLLLEESRSDSKVAAEARRAFATIADLVHIAQRSGDLRDGDPEHIVALIFGAVHGMADLEQFGLIKVEFRFRTPRSICRGFWSRFWRAGITGFWRSLPWSAFLVRTRIALAALGKRSRGSGRKRR